MAKKIQQFYIIKIRANKIIYNNLNLDVSLYEARKNDECVAVGDSQVLRTIRQVTNKEFLEEDLNKLLKQKIKLKNKIKKGVDIEENKQKLFINLREIDDLLFIPEYISVVSDKTSEYNKIAKNGFYVNGVKYLRFMCSAGNARTNTAFFVSEKIFNEVNLILQNGHKNIPMAFAKYNAYFSLTSSATLVVSNPKVCVVDDCEIKRTKKVEWVNENDNIEIKDVELDFNLWDGMGLISPHQAQDWSNELLLDYIPSAFCIRNAFIKGMVCVFDFHKFAYEIATNRKIKDIWGNEHHIDDIEVILTKSQFKLWNAYNSWKQYSDNLIKNNLLWGVSKFSPKVECDKVRTNYQFVQVLDMQEQDVKDLCEPTIDWLNGVIGKDINYIKLYLLGRLSKFDNLEDIWKNIQDPMIKALLINDNVVKDKYIANRILQSINKKIKESYYGKLLIDGNFQVRIKDPYALCEHIFGLKPRGILNDGECYCKYWGDKNTNEIIAMRSPLTWKSECHSLKVKNDETVNEWYKYITSGVVYNIYGCDDALEADAD